MERISALRKMTFLTVCPMCRRCARHGALSAVAYPRSNNGRRFKNSFCARANRRRGNNIHARIKVCALDYCHEENRVLNQSLGFSIDPSILLRMTQGRSMTERARLLREQFLNSLYNLFRRKFGFYNIVVR